jgi:hypothetical protein
MGQQNIGGNGLLGTSLRLDHFLTLRLIEGDSSPMKEAPSFNLGGFSKSND